MCGLMPPRKAGRPSTRRVPRLSSPINSWWTIVVGEFWLSVGSRHQVVIRSVTGNAGVCQQMSRLLVGSVRLLFFILILQSFEVTIDEGL